MLVKPDWDIDPDEDTGLPITAKEVGLPDTVEISVEELDGYNSIAD